MKRIWQYSLPSIKGEGWAEILIREDGFFAAVSDWGNYAYWWTSMGVDDARKFFLRAEVEWDYFAGKLGPHRHLDVEGSFQAVLDDIRQDKDLSPDESDELRDLVDQYKGNDDWEGFVRDDRTTDHWPEAFRFATMKRHPDVDAFAQKILPKLVAAIKAELAIP